MKKLIPLFILTASFSLLVTAQQPNRSDGMRFVPDVAAQFRSLPDRPDALGVHRGQTPDPSVCRHYQGMVRVDRVSDGTPYFIVTRSGNTPSIPGDIGCDDSDGETRNGHLVIFKMGSRTNREGERLRSNRLRPGTHIDATPPPSEDSGRIYYTVTGGYWPAVGGQPQPRLVLRDGDGQAVPARTYGHPGGMQVVGNILALAVEEPRMYGLPDGFCNTCLSQTPQFCPEACTAYERAPYRTAVMFFDVTHPEVPRFISQFVPRLSNVGPVLNHAGSLGITPLASGKYLMVIGGQGAPLYFYRSEGTDLQDPNLRWEYVDAAPAPDVEDEHQTLNFIREGNIEGDLYLAGARGKYEVGPLYEDRDRLDLYKVESCIGDVCSKDFNPGAAVTLTVRYNGQQITPGPTSGGRLMLSLAAASGFYVSPTGELIFYAAAHDNDGPNGTIEIGEWRHRDVFRPGSPLLVPTARINGEFVVDEGGAVELIGQASAPIARPFLQMFHGTNYSGLSLIADFDDRFQDDFYNLFQLERRIVFEDDVPTTFHHANKAQSISWYAPQGCSIAAVDRSNFPGFPDRIKTLDGTSLVRRSSNLANVAFDDGTPNLSLKLDSIEFLNNCTNYYSSPFNLSWDTDLNGSFETTGNAVTFNAANVDGPADVQIPARARSSTGGPVGHPVNARVNVRNVAPSVSQIILLDARNNVVGTDVPYVLTNRQVTFAAAFADPGRLDRQTASLVWGNGFFDSQTTFDYFNEAFGDGTGGMLRRRSVPNAGTFSPTLTVRDDDDGIGSRSATLRVLTPEQSASELVSMLNLRISQTINVLIRRDLERARADLGTSGALGEIRRCQYGAARTFLNQAVGHLEAARAKGANVDKLIDLVRETSAALPGQCGGSNA